MSAPIPIALLGFSSTERYALATAFRQALPREPAYVQVLDVDLARFVVADADEPGVPALLNTLGRTGDALFIGEQGSANAAAWVAGPIDPARVMHELDRLLDRRARAKWAIPGLQHPDARPAAPAAAPMAAVPAPGDAPDPAQAYYAAARAADTLARRQRREAALQPVTLRQALLVDDSEVALAFLERLLMRHGISADWAMNSSKAIELMSHRAYGMVFLDVDLGEHSDLDGLALCQHIKRRQPPSGGRAPLVVLVSAFNEPSDQVRGSLAGADGQIGKPVDDALLVALLQAHGLVPAEPARPPRRH